MGQLDSATLKRLFFYIQERDNCWLWTGFLDWKGYARFREKGQKYLAHRWTYELFNNCTIPSGLQVDHLCRHRNCVNPAHLELVSRTENLRRSPGRNIRGPCPHGISSIKCSPCLRNKESRRRRYINQRKQSKGRLEP